ncbi:S41 family peptidase [Candidatus Dojkabacteria bacterium]|nr:S41 family peptidase [Candidatus Dojkabacteria bacterium]
MSGVSDSNDLSDGAKQRSAISVNKNIKVSASGGDSEDVSMSKAIEEASGKSTSRQFLNIIGIVVLTACVFTIGFFSGKIWGGIGVNDNSLIYKIVGKTNDASVKELDFDLFWQVWDTLETQYVDKDISSEELYYGAIKGLVSGVDDPVTVFLTPEETVQYEEGNEGKFEGVGIELGYENGNIIVVAPLEGSPAQKAGMRSGDWIVKVDGKDISGKSIYEVVSLIRGEKDTDVVLTVVHKGGDETDDIKVTRSEISVPSVSYDGLEGKIAVVDVDRFTESSLVAWQNRWNEVMSEVKKDNPKAIILDLRGNPGGYFSAAVWAAGEFLEKGKVVVKQRNRDGAELAFYVERDGGFQGIPLVVLVDGGSASASEILSGALQYYDRAYIIGEETYGKGTAQEIIEYSDGSSLHITTLKWVLPDGEAISKEHVIKPDKVVELSDEDFENGYDPQLEAALEYLKSKI